MIRIAKLTDYGIVLMSHLARAPGRRVNARDLSVEAHLPQPTVSQLLKTLSRGGLLVSQLGVKGGYDLARPASEITVADIITALEGPVALTECTSHVPDAC